tara:strand:- start:804 stop:1742 length:939 start_codon:yes stop_codon:yes gene_type:complete
MIPRKFKTTQGSHIPIVAPSFKNIIYIFTSLKCTKYKILNILGLQVIRYFLAKLIHKINIIKFKGDKIYEDYDNLGYHVIHDVLSDEDLDKLRIEFDEIIKKKSINLFSKESKLHDNKDDPRLQNLSVEMFAHEFKFDDEEKKQFPEMYKLYSSKFINESFYFAEKKKYPKITMRVQRTIQNDSDGNEFNSLWHMDTFHDTHKGFLYLTEVKKENGPFNILEGSHKISLRHIFMEYINSIKFAFNKSTVSFRLDDKASNFPKDKKKEIICKPNTFVIANTHAFHRRGCATKGNSRDAIEFWTRENPFKLKPS